VQKKRRGRGRPEQPPHLVPEQPATVLGWTMRKLRKAAGWTLSQTAEAIGCHPSRLSRIEHHGDKPSRDIVNFYEEVFEGDGLLLSLFEVADSAQEQKRRRFGGHRSRRVRRVEGDATAFVSQSIPHGQLMLPGQPFEARWTIRNVGTVPWRGRRLERQGPLNGPGLIVSERYVPIADTEPGETVEITAALQAPGYDCTSIAYFKMVSAEGFLCFPDAHQLGLDVLVRVERNTEGCQDLP